MPSRAATDSAVGHTGVGGRSGLARWMPGLAALLHYEPSWLPRDLAAGLSVAAIALPVGIAYAELAGVPAATGIYAAIFPLVPYALLGSSRQLILGPDAATCIMVAASLGPLAHGDPARYLALLPVLTLITGALYVVAALARLGLFANFLSQPILTGYLNGVAIVIIVGQLPKLLGYPSEADDVLPRLLELVQRVDQSHLAVAALGLFLLVGLVALRRFAPALPAPLLAVAAGIAVVAALDLGNRGVALTGPVPAGLPAPSWTWFDAQTYRSLFGDAAGILLISFTSGVLTAKSFARRNRYEIDANQELWALGAANLAVGLGQGFPVTGADSRTAVNDAMGGRTQLVGIVAALAMLLVLLTLTAPLALVPTTALAAVILVSAAGLFDVAGLRQLLSMSRREGLMSIGTTVGVLVLGVLPGVVLAIVLSLFWLLATAMRPKDAVLGRLPGLEGFHSIADYPQAETIPGLLLYRFSANLLFFNSDYFSERVRAAIGNAAPPVEWVIVDLSPTNLVDATAVQRFDELREELAARGVALGTARAKRQLSGRFQTRWVAERRAAGATLAFPTLRSAVRAFEEARAFKKLPSGRPDCDSTTLDGAESQEQTASLNGNRDEQRN
jgi:sulfate permease, SulP family